MIDSMRRFNETMKQIKRDKKKGVETFPVRVFNVRRVGHNIPVPGLEVVEVRPMSLKKIKKRVMEMEGVHVLAQDSKEYYSDNGNKPKVISWKAYGKNTPPERVSRILA